MRHAELLAPVYGWFTDTDEIASALNLSRTLDLKEAKALLDEVSS